MALAEGLAPVEAQTFGEPPIDVSPLYEPSADWKVLGLAQNTRFPPDGRVIPDIDITFIVPGLPGTFLLRVDNYAFNHVDVLVYLRERVELIRALYEL